MKKTHIVGIIIIAVAIGAIFTSLSETSTYASFRESSEQPDNEFHVVGLLNRNKETMYKPEVNANEFIFYMTDNTGTEKKVVLHKSKPQDFERSEQIVIIGKTEGEIFHARDILLKCPSKYSEGTPQEKTKSS